MNYFYFFVISLFVCCFAKQQTRGHSDFKEYPFSITLADGNYQLYWNFSTADETIQFAVRVKTTGWVGFGISPNGQMPGSDVVIGWVDGDKTYFHDRYANERSLPPIDNMQDWFLISGAIHDGYTELEFSRNFTTCDNESKDLDILADTSRVVFSWNDNKPTVSSSGDEETYTFGVHQEQGSASVNLLGGAPNNAPTIPSNAEQFTVGVENIEIPNRDTTYWCKGLALDDLISNIDDTKYIIRFGPSLTEASQEYVHHMLVYTCNGLNDDDMGPGGPCFNQSERVRQCRGARGLLIAAWAVGGIDYVYPENVAYPIGGQDDHEFFVIEMHYNNPSLHSGVIDSSGVVFTYLNERREYDAGILFLGHQVSHYMTVPPGASGYTIPTFCPSDCMEEYIPSDGIKIFANMLHTHLAGTGLSLSVLRKQADGETYEETKVVERNLKYDFNFQQVTHLAEEITVLPDDELFLECFYSTENRKQSTLGGESTEEEMCLTFPIYYPRIEMNSCQSLPLYDSLTQFVIDHVEPADYSAFFVLQSGITRSRWENALGKVRWTDANAVEDFEKATYVTGTQYYYCIASDDEFIFIGNTSEVPVITKYYSNPPPVRNCTSSQLGASDGATAAIHMSLAVLLLFASMCIYMLQ